MRPLADVHAVLFDLDGTLADTAPDLANALNTVLIDNGREPLPYETIRPVVSHGGVALIRLGFGLAPAERGFERLRQRLLDCYRREIAARTRLFPTMAELLDELEARGLAWGVVTNKPAWLTVPLMEGLGLAGRAATIVSGDSLPQCKPDPAPMHLACRETGSAPEHCLYVGDAERDIQAGRRAGMATAVALWGYLAESDRPHDWGADTLLESPLAVLDHLVATAARPTRV